VSAIDCTKCIFEKWIKLQVVSNFRWYRCVGTWYFDVLIVQWSRRKEEEHFEEISATKPD
jgi:hypothetical protein